MSGKTLTLIRDALDPRLAPYNSLKGKMLERDGIFIAEGEKVVRSMAQSSCRIASCLASSGAAGRHKNLLKTLAKRGAAIYTAPDELIDRIIGFRFHKGIMAVGHCPRKINSAEGLKKVKAPFLLIALNGVNDPQNVGLIARNAAAFGAGALIVDNATYDPYYRKAVRVSMGAIFRLPVFYEDSLAPALRRIKKEHKARVIAATPGKGAKDISGVDLSGNICFVFGNEDKGVSREVLRAADVKARIPIADNIDSLNVAGAAAICLYEASLRRSGKR